MPLLGEPMDRLLTHLETAYNDGERFRLHYVTAREMYEMIRRAEAGAEGDPGPYLSELRSRRTSDSPSRPS